MTNAPKNKTFKILFMIIILVLILAITLIAILYPTWTKSDNEPKASTYFTLFDNINNQKVTLDIPCYIDERDRVYIQDDKAFESVKRELLAINDQFVIDIYNDILLYARIPNVANYYFLRQYSQDSPYGDLYYIYNMQLFDFGTPKAPEPKRALLPLHLFSAIQKPLTQDFPFGNVAITSDTKLAINGDINTFYDFYLGFRDIDVTIENDILYIRDNNIDQGYWALFEDGFVTYYPID